LIAIVFAEPANAVAVKVSGEPVRPVLVAVKVLLPDTVPSVQLVTVAMPLLLVVNTVVGDTAPPPLATEKVTLAPLIALPYWSVTNTLGAVATAVPTVADWPLPALMDIFFAVPTVAVAVKVSGEPVRPVLVAVNVLLPTVVPSVQLVTVAMPLLLVVTAVAGDTVPPPLATAKVTLAPLTTLPYWSFTNTLGAVATAVPTVADWPLPALIAIVFGAPAVAVAVKVSGEPVRPVLVAVNVLLPDTVPSVQLVAVAIPLLFVVSAVVGDTVPPPLATAKVTLAPLTTFPYWSVTTTPGAVVTAVPTVADWPLPPLIAIAAAAPATLVPDNATVGGVETPPPLNVILPDDAPAVVGATNLT
jgi:hypothetical protein